MTQPTYFIEVVKYPNGDIKNMTANGFYLLKYSLQTSIKFGLTTIAIFKVYPK